MPFRRSLAARRLLTPLVAIAGLVLFVPALQAQSATPPKAGMGHDESSMEDHHQGTWKELDAFHEVMGAGWHPAMHDSLAPARATATKLVEAARVLSKATAPMGCDAPAIKTAIARLVPESEAVAALVARNAEDAAIKGALKTVHDTFHIVEESCKPMKHD
jgi:hypothetical protein